MCREIFLVDPGDCRAVLVQQNCICFRLLREKTATDDEFVEFCKLRRGAAQDTLEALLDLPVSLFN